jgi:hypothetical protein
MAEFARMKQNHNQTYLASLATAQLAIAEIYARQVLYLKQSFDKNSID